MKRYDPARIRAIPNQYRVDLNSIPNEQGHSFETTPQARRWDELWLAAVQRNIPQLSPEEAKLAPDLIAKLFAGINRGKHSLRAGAGPGSLGTALAWRNHRIIEGEKVLKLIEPDLDAVRFATIVPNDEQFTAEELSGWRVDRFMARIRSALNREGARDAGGYLIGYFHCDYDPTTGLFSPHLHVLLKGGMIQVVDRLRSRAKYRSVRAGASPESPVYMPIKIDRRPLQNAVSAVTYLMKGYWPAIASGETGDGRHVRYGRRYSIPEPVHTKVLLWLHKHRFEDLRLLIGVRDTTQGLVPTKIA